MKKNNLLLKFRFYSTLIATFLLNLNIFGWSARYFCSPAFNCHGCPWATGACPIGVLAYGAAVHQLPLLALGSVLIIGLTLGRLVCSYACPFGLLQDLLYRIPTPKIRLPNLSRYLKYAALALLVFILPYLIGFEYSGYLFLDKPSVDKNDENQVEVSVTVENRGDKKVEGVEIDVVYIDNSSHEKVFNKKFNFPKILVAPNQCLKLPLVTAPNMLSNANLLISSPQSTVSQSPKYKLYYCAVCPSGTLTASLPAKFTAASAATFYSGGFFSLRYLILLIFLILMVFSSRPFCRCFCPLGAIYGLTALFSATSLSIDKKACVNCAACDKVCPVEIDVREKIGGPECIACGDCVKTCPTNCLHRTITIINPTNFKEKKQCP